MHMQPSPPCSALKLLYHPKTPVSPQGPFRSFPPALLSATTALFPVRGVLGRDISDEQESYGARPSVPAIVHVSYFQVPSTRQLLGHCSLSRLEIVSCKQTPLGVASSAPNSGCFLLSSAVIFGPTRLCFLQYLFSSTLREIQLVFSGGTE